jgi:CPA1 family monovalent cation:H+ antiporter
MLEAALIILGLCIVSSLLNQKVKIPVTITLLTLALVNNFIGVTILDVDGKEFDQIILMLLPLFIIADTKKLTLTELKDNSGSLLYTAFFSVLLSIGIGVLFNAYILPDYNLTIPALVMLFCMVMATDPITVTSVFSNFKLPHKLKLIAEGESLFNDAFALIFFFVALNIYNGQELTTLSLAVFSLKMIGGSIIIGLIFGFLCLFLLQLTKDVVLETVIILFAGYGSFYVAEHWHLAGILSIIVAVITAKTVIDKRIKESNDNVVSEELKTAIDFMKLNKDISDIESQKMTTLFIDFAVTLSSVVLFISMGEVMNISAMFVYWKEILAMFVATTIIRGVMMGKFAIISNKIKFMENISFHWWQVLTFAGVKGGLSILMVHLLPKTFEHKELFEAIVFGNIILSTFIYSLFLISLIAINKKKFDKECELEIH